MIENMKVLLENGEMITKKLDQEVSTKLVKMLIEKKEENQSEIRVEMEKLGINIEEVRGIEFSKGDE